MRLSGSAGFELCGGGGGDLFLFLEMKDNAGMGGLFVLRFGGMDGLLVSIAMNGIWAWWK